MLRLYLSSTILSFLILQVLGNDADIFSNFHQDEYKLKDLRLALESYDKDIFDTCELKTCQYNQSLDVFNGTIKTKINIIGKQIEIAACDYKFVNNKYRPFPIGFKGNLFNTIALNVVGLKEAVRCGNIPLDTFYFVKGVEYHFCNFYPDVSTFPPMLPLGKYMAEFKLFYKQRDLLFIRGYGELYVPAG